MNEFAESTIRDRRLNLAVMSVVALSRGGTASAPTKAVAAATHSAAPGIPTKVTDAPRKVRDGSGVGVHALPHGERPGLFGSVSFMV